MATMKRLIFTTTLFCSAVLLGSLLQAQDAAPAKPAAAATAAPTWVNRDGKPAGKLWEISDTSLHLKGKGAGDLWTKERYGDFELELEFKTTGNSGVFFRTDDPKQNVQTGIEVQVEKAGGPDKHSVGSLYDLQAPTKNAAKNGEWNKLKVTARGPNITVELNGEKVNAANLENWSEAGKNPDGSANKFKRALKDFKREGHIGFQDHGHEAWYQNIKIKPLAP